MMLWQIGNYADLQGLAGLRAPGHWHDREQPVVYLAEHAALALLETRVHQEIGLIADLPDRYRLLQVEVDGDADVAESSSAALPAGWQTEMSWTQAAGSEWLASGQSALLKVPSATLPHAGDYLLNPLHPHAGRINIVGSQQVPYDPRILALSVRR